jgi:hypothetical protein
MPRIVLDTAEVTAIAAGKRLFKQLTEETPLPLGPVALLDEHGALVALAEHTAEGYLQPRKVFC